MNTSEGKAWHALAGTKGVGPKTLWLIADYLAQQKKTASWLLKDAEKIKDVLYGSKANIVMPSFFDHQYEETDKSRKRQATVLHPLHPDFPQGIKILKDEFSLPALLYVQGNVAILNRPTVAIVGKRNAEMLALATADSLACELVAKGVNITSGYAAGIDTAAHFAALRAGGTTSIILAEGIQHFQVKPELQDHLTAENSLAISQFKPAAQWAAYMAMARNKLVGALSGAVVVIISGPERDTGGRHSGTFNAGISALKMGIPVFVVAPSFYIDPPPGNSQLIAKGCREWNPASGAAPIIAALDSNAAKNQLFRQLNLFIEK